MATASFDEFSDFIRQWGRISPKRRIEPETDFERDLGVSGDDGRDLLEAVEERFGISLSSEEHGYREAFNLAPDEFLFGPEGLWPDPGTLFGRPAKVVVGLTVGRMYKAVQEALAKRRNV